MYAVYQTVYREFKWRSRKDGTVISTIAQYCWVCALIDFLDEKSALNTLKVKKNCYTKPLQTFFFDLDGILEFLENDGQPFVSPKKREKKYER